MSNHRTLLFEDDGLADSGRRLQATISGTGRDENRAGRAADLTVRCHVPQAGHFRPALPPI
jgi:hypothetical protein